MTLRPCAEPAEMERYRSQPLVGFALGDQAQLLYFPLSSAARVVSSPEARLLAACTRFATLGGHTERILRALPLGCADAADIAGALKGLAAEGMMLSRADLWAGIASLPRPAAPARISWLAIPTCDRPHLLRRVIAGFADHFSNAGRFPALLISDDSPTPDGGRASRAVLEGQARGWGAAAVYSGPDEKRRLIDRLLAHGSIPREVLEFGVLGPRGGWSAFGANRNAILLQTAGGAVLSVDDDTLCESRAAAGADGVLVFSRPGVCPVVSA